MRRVRCLCVCMCPLVQHEVAACSWLYIVEILFGGPGGGGQRGPWWCGVSGRWGGAQWRGGA